MSQETRKDPRAKIVSLNVRYKSATVDEFIEDHSFDVSKGGVYIKTATPFATGTLLKFEMRLAGDQAVIAGVGRVVWRREPPDAGDEHPAGMGVKFIKIDDKSREIIDRLIAGHGDAGGLYQEGLANAPASVREAPTRPNASLPPGVTNISVPPRPGVPRPAGASSVPPPGKVTTIGMGAVSGSSPPAGNAAAASTGKSTMLGLSPTSPSGSSPPSGGLGSSKGKATMMGMGAVNKDALSFDDLKSVPPGAGGEPIKTSFFPESKDAVPPQEPTMMKQAAELLEEAFKEAGGSAEELGGTNPIFAQKGAASVSQAPPPSDRRSPSVRPAEFTKSDSMPPSRRNSIPAPISSASLLPAANPNRGKIVFAAIAIVLGAGAFAFLSGGGPKGASSSAALATPSATDHPASTGSAVTTAQPSVAGTASNLAPSNLGTASASAVASTPASVKPAASAVPAIKTTAPPATAKTAKPKATATATEGDPPPEATAKPVKPKATAKPATSTKPPDDDNPY